MVKVMMDGKAWLESSLKILCSLEDVTLTEYTFVGEKELPGHSQYIQMRSLGTVQHSSSRPDAVKTSRLRSNGFPTLLRMFNRGDKEKGLLLTSGML